MAIQKRKEAKSVYLSHLRMKAQFPKDRNAEMKYQKPKLSSIITKDWEKSG
jgi:hypothetical protein